LRVAQEYRRKKVLPFSFPTPATSSKVVGHRKQRPLIRYSGLVTQHEPIKTAIHVMSEQSRTPAS